VSAREDEIADADARTPAHRISATRLGEPSEGEPPLSSVSERAERGKSARRTLRRSGHATSRARGYRRDPIELLEVQGRHRSGDLMSARYARMLVSPYSYFRGAALPMASDLAALPNTGLRAQLCGDAHLSNFGVFRSPKGFLVFGVNNYDETAQGPFEWDLKRLAASLEIAGRDSAFDRAERGELVRSAVRSYREAMTGFAKSSILEVWSSRLDVSRLVSRLDSLLDANRTPAIWHDVARARAHDSHVPAAQLSEVREGNHRIVSDPPVIVAIEDLDSSRDVEWMQLLLKSYMRTLQPESRHLLSQYQVVHAAREVLGVAGAGSESWIVLLRDDTSRSHVHLRVKQAEISALERFLPKGAFSNQGQRIVYGQRLIEAGDDDVFSGWETDTRDGRQRDYYVSQVRDWRRTAETAGMTPASTELWGRMCGWALASAHARTGDRVAIASYLGRSDAFDCALVKFAREYADRNEQDFRSFSKATRRGRLTARALA
jgi:uncharacterized protein (DUF2252 family)